ncbi:MAG: quinone oxidoreductase [Pirellulaceae bacterium]|nr:MAG: quinone oxidoreductase [Pirellulaceae bacterium]
MKAAYFEQPGPPETIQYGDLPEPHCGPGQILVRVGAVSVNPIDTYIRAGANFFELPRPYILGCDFAGTVESVGEGVTQFKPGDRVWGSNQGLLGRQGTFAEKCVVDAQWAYPIPENVTDEAAAAVALVGITAHLGLFRCGQLKPGETIFIRGGVGGVGSMVVQMAKAIGAKVIATAGGAEKVELCRSLGADHVIDYTSQDIRSSVQSIAPDGVHLVWETLREPDFDLMVDLAAEQGRLILMAGRDARPPFPVGPFYVKCLSLHGFVMFKIPAEEQAKCAADINHWLSTGKLRPLIDRVLPLSQAAEAHRLQELNTIEKKSCLKGKLVLKP